MPEEAVIAQPALTPAPIIEDTAATCARIAQYRQLPECRYDGGQTNWDAIAMKLGWPLEQLNNFLRDNMGLIEYAEQISIQAAEQEVAAPTEAELIHPGPGLAGMPGAPPTPEEMAMAVARADEDMLQGGLESLGLTPDEAKEAVALQKFNHTHFIESMDMISAGVLRTSLRAQMEQKKIQERLEFVRAQIATFGEFHSDDLAEWEKKERLLMRQFTDVGDLLNNIQDTWYKGAAALAVIKMKARENNGHKTGFRTQRSNKPGFRPFVSEEGGSNDESTNPG